MAVDMPPTPTVEASSLSSLLELASNPPTQPDVRIQLGAAPLVLYIARVPGSRDVFLTPIKPRERVVTASDVQSSLYYVHVNCREDSQQKSRPSSVSTNASNLLPVSEQAVKRKVPPPLPKRPAPPVATPVLPPYPLTDQMPALPPRPGAKTLGNIARKPLLPERPTVQTTVDLPVIPSRPLPPTPPAEDEDVRSPSSNEDTLRSLQQESHVNGTSSPHTRDSNDQPETPNQLELDCIPSPGTLTLIRRNPGTNEQWNVGTIHDPPIPEISSTSLLVPTAKRRTKKGGAPVYLDITNAGYEQFLHRPQRSGSSISASTTTSEEDTTPAPQPAEGVFRRRLYMPGSKYADHSYGSSGHRKHASVASGASSELEIPRTLRYDRHHSVDLGMLDGNGGAAKVDMRSKKAYTFTSPWDGRCEFTTGATGRSLKCRHHLPDGSGGGVVEVSELRFNLPTSTRSAQDRFSSHRPRHWFRDDDEDGGNPVIAMTEDGRIDLSLGQERAGGGFGGRQAKLGKLIVEPQGFGMLDLLVAANLGLWWRAWERL